jgi:hypothetical protein
MAGVLGALAVAALFLIRDLTLGIPFLTPSVLGQIILQGSTAPVTDRALFGPALAYTGLHFAVFILFGMLLAGFARAATTQPSLRFALVMIFIFFEFFFTGLSFMFFEATQALFPLALVLFANLLAGAVMAVYLWRHHPALRRAVHRDPLGLGAPHSRG